ncbi:unnamed protein product [Gongylonema pulchrum]|uniref:Uncharacterized protein n=1 Tax=Gongylonema pulchrum TaxID=637853 RepID=A0A183DGL6_9BILA|nr:unnamed protein product [Gongylonema pulchrum]
MKGLVPYLFNQQPDLLHHMTTTLNPYVFIEKVKRVAFNRKFFFHEKLRMASVYGIPRP